MSALQQRELLSRSISIPKPVIYFAKTLQFISHPLLVRFGIKLFTTPINFDTPEREKMMEKSAQKKTLFIKSIDKTVQILSYGYSKKKVLLAHGWAGRSTQLFAFADKLLENGYMVISFDGPAHGKSSGKTTNLSDFTETIKAINTEFGPFETAIGHSFGGLTLYNCVAEGVPLKSLVTIGAGNTISEIISDFAENLTVKPIIAIKMKKYLDIKWRQDLDNHSSANKAKKITIPVLIVHDSKDADVSVSCAHKIRQNTQNGSLLITQDLGHTKILRNQKVIQKVVEFIKQNNETDNYLTYNKSFY